LLKVTKGSSLAQPKRLRIVRVFMKGLAEFDDSILWEVNIFNNVKLKKIPFRLRRRQSAPKI